MAKNKILAFSSSRVGTGGYLQDAAPQISTFLGSNKLNIVFIPFASVDNDEAAYCELVKTALAHCPYTLEPATSSNAVALIKSADVIMVGGGNTFKLLHDIYALKILDLIRDKVNAGCPYIGWSAGSNILSPGIGTTNDMPVIEPQSFNALGLFPFQVNPHYNNATIANHNGETRDQRLKEFVRMNPGLPVVALPEGTALHLEDGVLRFTGSQSGFLFGNHQPAASDTKQQIEPGTDISYLL